MPIPAPPPSPPLPPTTSRRRWWKGAKPIPLFICLAVGLIIRFAIPKPHKLTHGAWTLLAIFITTILGLILSPLPVSAWALLCLTVCLVTKTLAFSAAFSAFTNEVIWLIVFAYFFSKGFVKTGLGDRIAMVFVRLLGKNTLGLSYGLVLGELVISPGMPSSTARAGGIFLPLIKALALGVESRPKDPSSRRLGSFLIQSQIQSCNNTSALFLTAAAQNLLCLKLAESGGVNIQNRWVVWLKAACVPSLLALLTTPIILYKIYPPQVKHTPDAPDMARQRLAQMGRIKTDEWVMIATLLLTIALWISGESLHMPSVVAAMIGLSILLACGVIDWDDCLSEKQAWDTLTWFGVLIGMATQLTALGVIPWMSDRVGEFLKSLSLSPFGAFGILQVSYFFVHYLFASQTAHVGALYSAFLGMHLASKVPGLLSALALAYNTNLFGAITHYSSGQAAVYYGAGYVELRDVFVLGILMALINVTIWVLVAAAWWKVLGLY